MGIGLYNCQWNASLLAVNQMMLIRRSVCVVVLVTLSCLGCRGNRAPVDDLAQVERFVVPVLSRVPSDSQVVSIENTYGSWSLGEVTDGLLVAKIQLGDAGDKELLKEIALKMKDSDSIWHELPLSDRLLAAKERIGANEMGLVDNNKSGFYAFLDRSPKSGFPAKLLSPRFTLLVYDKAEKVLYIRVDDF